VTELKTACVIGAGSSGMVAVKALSDAAVDFDCFEKCTVLGGNWAFGSPWSAAYRTLHINSYRADMEYADFPMPAGMPDFPHHEQVAAYFNSYADHFCLRPLITFDVGVEHVEPRPEGGWSVTLSTGEVRAYRFVVVATGHHNTPRFPTPPFPGAFSGTELHAHDYRDMSQLAGKNVLVVGMGNSAMDIAVESSYVARQTFLSARRGAYIIPKYILGRPSLPLPAWLPWQVRQFLFQRIVRVAVGPVERYGLPKPRHKILQTHPTVSDTLLSRLSHGAVTPKPDIAELCGDSARFVDVSVARVDTIVYCTGYRITFPFFDEAVFSAPENHLELYHRVFPLGRRDLALIGYVQPWGSIMPAAEAQANLVADYLRGAYALPGPAARQRWVAEDEAATGRRYVASKRHTIQIDMPQYVRALKREQAAGRRRAETIKSVAGRVTSGEGQLWADGE
jgi:cation diffusion facilitator CzcD-associated flavoprotein CzcO